MDSKKLKTAGIGILAPYIQHVIMEIINAALFAGQQTLSHKFVTANCLLQRT